MAARITASHAARSAILWDIPWGWSWEQTRARTPATINGFSVAHPSRCVNTGLNMWSEWDVPDPSCSSFVDPAADGCYALWSNATNRFLSHHGTAFYLADRLNVGAWERFRLVGTGDAPPDSTLAGDAGTATLRACVESSSPGSGS